VLVLLIGVMASPDLSVAGTWRDTNPDAYITPPANPQLNSVYMLSSAEGWAVGDSRPTTNATTGLPAIFHYDGFSWNSVPAPKVLDFPGAVAAYNLTSVTFGPPLNPISRSDGWAVGFNNTIDETGTIAPAGSTPCGGGSAAITSGAQPCSSVALHWDGISWRVMTSGLSGLYAGPLWSAFMVSSTDVWAVGQNVDGTEGVFWHWSGVAGLGGGWSLQTHVPTPLYSVFMVSPTEGWAVGKGGAIYRYFGGGWTSFASPVTVNLRSVFLDSSTDGWGVGDAGTIIRYNTGIWTGPVSPGTTFNNLFSVYIVSSTEGWAVGAFSTIVHFAGGTWTATPVNLVPTAPISAFNFTSVFYTASTDGWSVGTAGVVLHFDGSSWGTVTSPTINNFTSVSFGPPLTGPINPNDGWAVGNASLSPGGYALSFEPTIYHWNGFMWSKGVVIGATNDLNSVFMLNSGDAWTVGGGPQATASCTPNPVCPLILHWDGGSWNTVTPPPGSYKLKSVFMVSSSEGWAVGEIGVPLGGAASPTGIILHYTVTGGTGTWAIFPAPSSPLPPAPLNSVFMLGPDEGWAVGDNATILHYTVVGGAGTWNPVIVSGTPGLSRDANLTSVFMLSPTSGWAVGGVTSCAACDSTFFNTGPVIVYWDGSKWSPVATPLIPGGISPDGVASISDPAFRLTTGVLKSVYCTGSNDCWTAGYPGKLLSTLFHWDGVAWSFVSLSPDLLGQDASLKGVPPILTSIYMTSPGSGWIVGSGVGFSTFYQLAPVNTGSPLSPRNIATSHPLSTILRFAPSAGVATAAYTVLSTVTSSTTFLVSSVTSTTTNIVTVNSTASVAVTQSSPTIPVPPGGIGIPGFTAESIAAGIIIGLVCLALLRRRRTMADRIRGG
jgi:photosystem II stability/assembly factor-like uncharacterized protein